MSLLSESLMNALGLLKTAIQIPRLVPDYSFADNYIHANCTQTCSGSCAKCCAGFCRGGCMGSCQGQNTY